MARISGIDLPRDKRIVIGLTYIYGIGRPTAEKIVSEAGINPDTRVRDLTDAEEAKLKAIIEENHAQDYIHLKGHQDLTEVYKDYELYLSGSKSEGFGLTLLEAVGSGLGMIGFDVRYGNQTFIKDNENGYLIPRFEKDDELAIVAALAEKIVAFFNRSDLDHVHQVSYDIAKGFLTEEIEQKWLNLVKEMTNHD